MEDRTSKFEPGEIVDITIKGARVRADDHDDVGFRVLTVTHGEISSLLHIQRGEDVTVERVAPPEWHSAGITGMVHGVVRLGLIDAHIRYVLVPPASLKKYAAGRENATKADMRMALYQRAGLDLRDDNQVDAAWLRFMGLDALDHPAVKVPQAHREALAKVTWPEVPDGNR